MPRFIFVPSPSPFLPSLPLDPAICNQEPRLLKASATYSCLDPVGFLSFLYTVSLSGTPSNSYLHRSTKRWWMNARVGDVSILLLLELATKQSK